MDLYYKARFCDRMKRKISTSRSGRAAAPAPSQVDFRLGMAIGDSSVRPQGCTEETASAASIMQPHHELRYVQMSNIATLAVVTG